MKDSTGPKEKTTRRSFAKTVATALVAVPVVTSLTSCARESTTPPSPSPTPTPQPRKQRGSNPPVIIDGGSFQIAVPATLKRMSDEASPPNPPNPAKTYNYKFKQKNDTALGAIAGIIIVDDYAYELLPEYTLSANETLQVQLWIAKATESGDDESDTDTAVYENISTHTLPDIVIQGGKIEIRCDKNISKDRKIMKRKGKNQKRYHLHDWDGGHTPFRIEKIKVFVSTAANPIYGSQPGDEEYGFRIILIFP